MKTKFKNGTADELRPEYDLRQLLKDGVRGKYAARCREGTNLVLLEPEVAKAFPTDSAVNEALRLVLQLSRLSIGSKKTAAKPHAAKMRAEQANQVRHHRPRILKEAPAWGELLHPSQSPIQTSPRRRFVAMPLSTPAHRTWYCPPRGKSGWATGGSERVELETATQEVVEGAVCGPVRIQIEGFRPIFSEVVFIEMRPDDGEYEPLIGYLPSSKAKPPSICWATASSMSNGSI